MNSKVIIKKLIGKNRYQLITTPSARLSLIGLLVSIARLRLAWHQEVTEIWMTQYISFNGRPTVILPMQRFDQKIGEDCSS